MKWMDCFSRTAANPLNNPTTIASKQSKLRSDICLSAFLILLAKEPEYVLFVVFRFVF